MKQCLWQIAEAAEAKAINKTMVRLAIDIAVSMDWAACVKSFTSRDLASKLKRDHSRVVRSIEGLKMVFDIKPAEDREDGYVIRPAWDGVVRFSTRGSAVRTERTSGAVRSETSGAEKRTKVVRTGRTTEESLFKSEKNPSGFSQDTNAQARAPDAAAGAPARAPHPPERNSLCPSLSKSDLPSGTPGSPITPEPNKTIAAPSWNGMVRTRAGRLRRLDGLCPPSGPPETPEQRKAEADRRIAELKASGLLTDNGRAPPTPPTPYEIAIAERREAIVAASTDRIVVPRPAPKTVQVSSDLVASVQNNPKFREPAPRVETQKAPDDLSPWAKGER